MQFELDPDTRALLDRFGFDEGPFQTLRQRFIRGELGASGNRLRGRVEPPGPGDLVRLPAPESAERKQFAWCRGAAAR